MGRGQKRLERDEGQSHVEDRNHGLIRRKRTFAVQLYCTAFQGLYRLPRPLRPHADMVTFAIADLISHLWSTSSTTTTCTRWMAVQCANLICPLTFPRARERNPCFTTTDRRPQLRARRSAERERGDMQRTRGFEWEDGGDGRGGGRGGIKFYDLSRR